MVETSLSFGEVVCAAAAAAAFFFASSSEKGSPAPFSQTGIRPARLWKKISIFSTADSIKRTYEQPSETGGATEAPGDAEAGAVGDDANEPVEVVFNANGTVEPPHTIVIYPEALSPEKGIAIKVDRFGEPKCEDLEGR